VDRTVGQLAAALDRLGIGQAEKVAVAAWSGSLQPGPPSWRLFSFRSRRSSVHSEPVYPLHDRRAILRRNRVWLPRWTFCSASRRPP